MSGRDELKEILKEHSPSYIPNLQIPQLKRKASRDDLIKETNIYATPVLKRWTDETGIIFEVPTKYEITQMLSFGGYGSNFLTFYIVVVFAYDKEKKKNVAIKKIPGIFEKSEYHQKQVLRELKILKHFNGSENIISIIDIILPSSYKDFNNVYYVMDYYDSDLNKILRSKTEFSENDIRYFLINILLGVHHLHSANVLHRDLKPHNILVNSEMSVKICDFGLSRGVNDMDPIGGILTDTTPTVQTQWYKSPEQLLCFAKGRREMDVWSAGCIFAELLKPKGKRIPMFPGKLSSDYSQILSIVKILGKPKIQEIKGCQDGIEHVLSLPEYPKKNLKSLFPNANPDAVDLLEKMLTFDPAMRISIPECLNHPFLGYSPKMSNVNKFVFEEKNLKDVKKLIYDEIVDWNMKMNGICGDATFVEGIFKFDGKSE